MNHNPSDGSAYLEQCWEKGDLVPPPLLWDVFHQDQSKSLPLPWHLALGTWHIMFFGNENQNTNNQIGKLGKT